MNTNPNIQIEGNTIQTTQIDACHIFTSSGDMKHRYDKNGYVMVKTQDNSWKHLHRLIKGDPKGLVVYRIKECTKPDCLNVDHLKVGDRAEARRESVQRVATYLEADRKLKEALSQLVGLEYKDGKVFCKSCNACFSTSE